MPRGMGTTKDQKTARGGQAASGREAWRQRETLGPEAVRSASVLPPNSNSALAALPKLIYLTQSPNQVTWQLID